MMETDNIVLEHLRAIRGDIAAIKDDMRGMKAEMTAIRQHMGPLSPCRSTIMATSHRSRCGLSVSSVA